jgi:putative cell wall-binding protein
MFTRKAAALAVLLGMAASVLAMPIPAAAASTAVNAATSPGRLVGPMYTSVGSIAWWGSASEGEKVPVAATDPHLQWSIPQVGGVGDIRLGDLCLTVELDFFKTPTLEKCDGSAGQEFTTVVNAQDPTQFGVRTTALIDPYLTGTPEPLGILSSTFFSSPYLQTFPVRTVETYSLGLMTPQAASTAPAVSRIDGSDRFETSAAVSKAAYPAGGVPVAFVASGAGFPDAIAAGPAAAKLGGPLLLTGPDTVPASVLTELKRLAPAKIVIVGGTAAVSDSVRSAVSRVQSNVVRVAGVDRFETSRQLATYAFPVATGAYFASGMNFPDALSASSAAAASQQPVLLVGGSGAADAPTNAHVKAAKITSATIVGGPAVIETALDQSLRSSGLTVARKGGADRFETSHLVNSSVFTNASTVYLASGAGFPDALSGAAIAGAAKAPLFLSGASCIPRAVLDDITALSATKVVLIGGTIALRPEVAAFQVC